MTNKKPFNARLANAKKWLNDHEKCDPIPVCLPEGAAKPPTLQEQIQRFVSVEINKRATTDDELVDSFEEENDFEPEQPDVIPLTAYELNVPIEETAPPLDPQAPQDGTPASGDLTSPTDSLDASPASDVPAQDVPPEPSAKAANAA